MGEIGRFALLAGLVVALYGLAATTLGIALRHGGCLASGRRAVAVWALLVALASAALLTAFLTRDFSVRFVALVSDSAQPLGQTIAAFWGGHDGALLLWALILAGYMVAAVWGLRSHPDLQGPATATLLFVAVFFSILLAGASNPFSPLVPPPPDGQGLNPLLRNPWMLVHPPMLYLGFVGMSVPFALAVASLITGRLDETWVALSRRWVIVPWIFLTLGLLLGAKWSYVVLGWGGYWAWDPVENAALMPWLTATAFIHSVQVQQRRGMLAAWNMALVLLTFGLTVLGTFLVRSGVLSSVHAFAEAPLVGYLFLGFLAILLLASFGLLTWRWESLRGRGTVESVLCRETAFLANNLLFVAAAFVVLLGTLFPILTEALGGVKINVGPPYFNTVMVPIGVGVLLLMGIGPLLPWRQASPGRLARNLALPAAAAVLCALVLGLLGVRHAGALLVLATALFVLGTIVQEAVLGTWVRVRQGEAAPVALARLFAQDRRRYGGHVAHLGILLLLAGTAASSVFDTQAGDTLRPGERMSIGRYTIEYGGLSHRDLPGTEVTEATLRVWAGDKYLGAYTPGRYYYRAQEQPVHHVAVRSTPREDLYMILSEWTPDGAGTIRVLVHPMVSWLWAGGAVAALGAALAVLPERRLRAQ